MTVCTKGKVEPPEKLKGIPQSAFWGGGPDGGCWFVVTDIGSRDIYHFTIYFDTTAKIWYQGKFKLTGKPRSFEKLKKDINGYFGGDEIPLIDGAYLVKIK